MTLTARSVSPLDLTDPASLVDNDPYAYWERMRAEAPVAWHESPHGIGFWSVARHADVVACYKDSAGLSSARGTVLDVLLRGGDSAGGRMLAVMDRPRHRALRRVLQQAFSPRLIRRVERQVTTRADNLVAAVVGTGPVDFAAEVAEALPINTICDLLELPASDRPDLLAWNKRALSSDADDADPMDPLEARNEILDYFVETARERRRRPGEDVISMLANVRVEDEPLSDDDIALNCYSLILGGDESTRMSTIGALDALGRHEDQWNRLTAGSAAVGTAVEEVLRWVTPAMHFARTATRELLVGGQRIRAGDIVSMWNISANNDPAVFDEPRSFDVGRVHNPHVSLGHGPHFCLGAFLGRLELTAVLNSIIRRVSTIEVLAAPPRVYSTFLFGYTELRLVLR
ncbi:Cytochrome P450 [Actinopolyspora alba]|uniref:Cytochrome P450 n=1 Tax=Actinopolyspora alba TaxID=673379 RepID=A0A1I2AX72_9ACTN|nr:cytochrome P450 [Actinopolyspora alba]SFE48426.1 Cytochrome P450 [Actinopolyspora alba]